MKNLFVFFLVLILISISKGQTGPSFSLLNLSGTNSITCTNLSVNYNALATGSPSFAWVSSNATLTGASVSITLPGTYTVTATDTSNLSSSQFITIGINTFAPVSSISPSFALVSCSFSSAVTFTGSSTSTNVTQYFMSPFNGSVTAFTPTALYTPLALGVYTHVVVNNINGCGSSKTFTISSNQGFPICELVSPQNFTLGCGTKSTAVISIFNAQSNPPGSPLSYTLLPPNFTFSYNTSTTTSYTVSTPGTWTIIVKDNFSSCQSRIPISIISNISIPNIHASVSSQTLTCDSSQVTLSGSSTSSNVSYNWDYSGGPSVLTPTILVQTNPSAPSTTLLNTYTLTVTDNNGCSSNTVIPMYQNTFKPNAAISSGGIFTLTCLTPTIALTNVSSSGIPLSTGFPLNLPVIGLLWTGPAPLAPAANSSTYLAQVAGIYTMTAKDQNNGCTATTTLAIVGDCNKVGIEKNSSSALAISIYPNPNKGVFTLLTSYKLENLKVDLYNTLGVLVRTETVNSEKTLLNIENVARGIYLIHVIENNKIIHVSKLIKD